MPHRGTDICADHKGLSAQNTCFCLTLAAQMNRNHHGPYGPSSTLSDISSDLTWTRQINEVASKATSMTGWALRTFQTRKELPMITIWNSLVRPCLDYCSPVWSPRPSNFQEIDLLEGIQRSFTRQIDGMEGLDYAQRLEKLHMYSIQRRNERFKIINIYKIKEVLVPNV